MANSTKRQPINSEFSPWLIGAAAIFLLIALGILFRGQIFPPVTATPVATSTPSLLAAPTLADFPIGSVTVRSMGNVQGVYLFAEPNPEAEKLGEALAGEQGELFGQDVTGEWFYVQFGQKRGWAPVYFFDAMVIQ